MEIIGFIGMILAIAAFILLVFNRINMIFSAVVGMLIICLTSWMPVMETLNKVFMPMVGGFLTKYLALFILSALFGKIMEDSGAARRIALTLSNLTKKSKNNRNFLVVLILPVFYFILSYVGISGFVVVFTVVAVGRELFEESDIPWALYCYGSAGIFPAILLGGSLQAANVIGTGIFKVPTTAGFLLSIIQAVIAWIVLIVIIKMDVKKCVKDREGFLPTGETIKKLQLGVQRKEEELPSLLVSVLPLLVVIAAIIAGVSVLPALTGTIIVSTLLFWNKFISFKTTLGNGINAAIGPVVNVAMATGLVSVITASKGFGLVLKAIEVLPSYLPAVAIIAIMSAFVASSSSSMPSFGEFLVSKYAQAGISAEIAARMTVASGFTYMTPHSAGIVNAVSLTKLDYKRAGWIYFKSTFFPGLVSMAVSMLLIALGVFK